MSENLGVVFASFSQMYELTTVILLVVSVPVLSEQMAVAFPIVSHASKCRTKLLSFIIFLTEYASDRVTASGSPSGTATYKNRVLIFFEELVGNYHKDGNTDDKMADELAGVFTFPWFFFNYKSFHAKLYNQN